MLRVELHISKANAALDMIPGQVVKAIEAKVRALTINLQRHIVADKLQGQVLNHRTGALGRSIQQLVERSGDRVEGKVYSSGDVKYAAIHEFGFHGSETVKQHMRTTVFGLKVEPFSVGPFTRTMNMPERSFMRSGLADMAEEIVKGLRAAAVQGAREAMGQP